MQYLDIVEYIEQSTPPVQGGNSDMEIFLDTDEDDFLEKFRRREKKSPPVEENVVEIVEGAEEPDYQAVNEKFAELQKMMQRYRQL